MTDVETPPPPRELKMWLAVRADLAMPVGKLATQAGHAYLSAGMLAQTAAPERFADYMANAQPKITCKVGTSDQLMRVYVEARQVKIPAYLVVDAGRTVFGEPTPTVCAFGPAYRDELPPFLKRLQLL